MEQSSTFTAIRDLLRQGDTAQALAALIAFLEQDRRSPEALRLLRVAEANYHAARQQELKGILAFSEAQRTYNQVNDTVLAVLDDLEAGRREQRVVGSRQGAVGTKRMWLIGGIIALLLVGLAAWALWPRNEADCPTFRGQGPRALVLPFQNLEEAKSRPELVIQSRIQELSGKNNFPLAVEVLTGYDAAANNPDIFDAAPLGKDCGADLVIWGLYVRSGDSLKVDARFAFVHSAKGGSTGFQAFADVTGLLSGRMLKSLDDAVFSLCGLLAVREHNLPLAKKWFGKVKDPDERDRRLLEHLNRK